MKTKTQSPRGTKKKGEIRKMNLREELVSQDLKEHQNSPSLLAALQPLLATLLTQTPLPLI